MQLAKETSTGHAGSEQLMRTSLQAIAQKAKRLKSYRFRNLYRMLNYNALAEAWKTNNKKAAAGVDKITAKEYAEELKQNLANLAEQLEKKRYRAKLVRRVDIPKGEGKTRPLGIPAIADKLVQSAAARILETIYEQDLLPKRLNKFGLELAAEKTQVISFNRWQKEQNTCFEFLGFEFRWGTSRHGKIIITRRTARKRLKKSLAKFKEWCRENRNKRLRRLFPELNSKLRGYYNYYGLIGNFNRLKEFYDQAIKTLYKWLNRRSQRKSFEWSEFKMVLKRYGVLTPRIMETNQKQLSFGF